MKRPRLDIKKIEETPHLLDILLEIEDVLDSLDVYVFRNWMAGELVEGPIIRRYWVAAKFLFEGNNMPDPRAGLRLLAHGIAVKFTETEVEEMNGDLTKVWFVDIEVPRKLINGMNDASTDFYDDEIDSDDIESAKDMGVDDESGVDQSGGETTK